MHELTNEYISNRGFFEEFKSKVELLLKELLTQNNVNCHKIESRTKETVALDKKIIRKMRSIKLLTK